jgi:hypothetical protein
VPRGRLFQHVGEKSTTEEQESLSLRKLLVT